MQISELSARPGVSTLRLRRYESLGLISSSRQANGYRNFSDDMVKSVVFIDMSREIGFSLDEIAELIPRYKARTLTAKEMIDAMTRKVAEIDQCIAAKQLHRRKLIDHIEWFKSRKRRPK